MGFGDFMKGLQGGIATGKGIRRSKQEEELGDIILRREKNAEREEMDWLDENDPNFEQSTDSLGDTYGGKLAGWVGDKLGIKRSPYYTPKRTPGGTIDVQDVGTAEAAEAAEAVPDMAPGTISTMAFDPRRERMPVMRDGGRARRALPHFDAGGTGAAQLTPEQIERARLHEEVMQRAERARAADRGGPTRGTQTIEGATRGKGTLREALNSTNVDRARNVMTETGEVTGPSRGARAANWARRSALNGPVARAVAPLALGATALEVARTPTEDYYERFGLDPRDPSLPKDLAVRTGGAATDLASTLTLGATEGLYADKVRKRKEATQGAPPPPAAKPAEPPAEGGRSALPSKAEDIDDLLPALDQVQFDDMKPGDVTNMTVKDWEKFRRDAMRSQIIRGVPIGEAANVADQQATQIQQRGFATFANQAIRLMAANNTTGAMAALKAAYQMAPTGDDINLGTYNGQIYGVTIDEATGKPTGQPMPITPASISALLKEAAVPGAWEDHAKDRRDFARLERQYKQVTLPTAQANIDRSGAIADYNTARATGQGGMSEAQNRYNMTQFEQRLEMLQMQNPQLADQYRSEMQRLQNLHPQLLPGEIIELVLEEETGGKEG